jgi:SAM-dependent methyltransferase
MNSLPTDSNAPSGDFGAALGFERSPQAYHRGRPDYPAEAAARLLEVLNIGSDSQVLELGAGTGKFTRFLEARAGRVFASDPSPAMRTALGQHRRSAHLFGSRAEQIAVKDHAVDSVVCAQAFHWFEGEPALGEIRRVLKDDGSLGLIWNVRDEEEDWISELTAIMDPYSGAAPRYRSGDWRKHLEENSSFTPLRCESFRHTVHCDRTMVRDRIGSISFIARLPDEEHAGVLAQVDHLLDTHPLTRDKSEYHFPYRTDLFWCNRR